MEAVGGGAVPSTPERGWKQRVSNGSGVGLGAAGILGHPARIPLPPWVGRGVAEAMNGGILVVP